GMNDGPAASDIALEVFLVRMGGPAKSLHRLDICLGLESASELVRVPREVIGQAGILVFEWRGREGAVVGTTAFFPPASQYYDLPQAGINARWTSDGSGHHLTLQSDACAFFVTAQTDCAGYFSDNCVTLLPGRGVTLSFTPRKGAAPTLDDLKNSLRISHLAQTY